MHVVPKTRAVRRLVVRKAVVEVGRQVERAAPGDARALVERLRPVAGLHLGAREREPGDPGVDELHGVAGAGHRRALWHLLQALDEVLVERFIEGMEGSVGVLNDRALGAIEIVNQAQADYVSTYVQANLPQYASLPVLSVSAPFKSGFGGGTDFTDVAAGPLAINNAADLYLYPNTIYAVKVAGSDIKNWLETAAKRFNTIDPTKATVQKLVSTFPGYNFDMFTDPNLTYEIDVTQAVGSRIKNLQYKGVAIDPNAQFIVATNNYRASGGGNFPGLDGSKTIYASPDANRDVLISYIKKIGSVKRATNGSQRSWRFTKLASSVAQVQFSSAPGRIADATAAGINNVTQVAADDGTNKGLAVYQIDLTQ